MDPFNKEKLADATQQIAQLQARLAAAKQDADQHAASCVKLRQELKTKLDAAQSEQIDTAIRLSNTERDLASLQRNLDSLAGGESLYVRVGDMLYLYSSIHRIGTDADGNLTKINDHSVDVRPRPSAEWFVKLLMAHHNRRRAPR